MAEINIAGLQPSSPVACRNKTKHFIQTSLGALNIVFSSIVRLIESPRNFNINQLDSFSLGNKKSEAGFLKGRRPSFGLLYPRGYFNK
jgi:hypothetical protein